MSHTHRNSSKSNELEMRLHGRTSKRLDLLKCYEWVFKIDGKNEPNESETIHIKSAIMRVHVRVFVCLGSNLWCSNFRISRQQ